MPLNEEFTFESDATGAIATGWTGISGTWQVHTTTPVGGSKAFGSVNPTATDDTAVRSGVSQAGMRVVSAIRVRRIDATNYYAHGVLIRASADGANGYLIATSPNVGRLDVYRKVSGAFALLTSTADGSFPFADGEVWRVKTEVQDVDSGGVVKPVLGWKCWKDGAAEPASFTTFRDDNAAAIMAAGTYGLRTGKSGTLSDSVVYDNVQASDAGVDYVAGPTASTSYAVSGPANGRVGQASGNFTVDPNNDSLNGTITLSDGGAGGVFTPSASLTWAGTAEAKFVTYTAPDDDPVTISFSNDAGLPNPAPLKYFAGTVDVGEFNFTAGADKAGLTTVGYRVIQNGEIIGSQSSVGVVESASEPGLYHATVYGTPGEEYTVIWSTGDAEPVTGTGLLKVDEEPIDLTPLLNLLQADQYVVTTTTPWQLVYMQAGTGAPGVGTELLRKNLLDTAGAGIASATTPIGRRVQP